MRLSVPLKSRGDEQLTLVTDSVNVHLPKDRISMSHQGYGFCEFLTEEDAEYACKIMNQIKLYGKPIRVNKVRSRSGACSGRAGADLVCFVCAQASSDRKQLDIGANLFVGNLDPNLDERMLFDTFASFGTLVSTANVRLSSPSSCPAAHPLPTLRSLATQQQAPQRATVSSRTTRSKPRTPRSNPWTASSS